MNLFETLQQLKTIEPDQAYREKSKRLVLATIPQEPASIGSLSRNIRRTFIHIFETGVAVALTAFFVIIITGQFANAPITPVQFSAIDPQTLHAEAQAVDIQIQLAQIAYEEATSSPVVPLKTGESTPAQAGSANAGIAPELAAAMRTATGTPAAGGEAINGTLASSTGSTGTSSTLSVDQALKILSQ